MNFIEANGLLNKYQHWSGFVFQPELGHSQGYDVDIKIISPADKWQEVHTEMLKFKCDNEDALIRLGLYDHDLAVLMIAGLYSTPIVCNLDKYIQDNPDLFKEQSN